MKPRTNTVLLAAAAVLLPTTFCFCLVMTRNHGAWPKDWPKELEPLRATSRTIEIATGLQQNIHEIPFSDRETFERIWPVILKLKSQGAPLSLYCTQTAPPVNWGSLLSNEKPMVRIYAPSGGHAGGRHTGELGARLDVKELVKQGKMLHAAPPWPKHILSPEGELPEFVQAKEVDGKLTWAPADRKLRRGFLHRARVDIELVVDGRVIDLNRILLPGGTPVTDKRWDDRAHGERNP